MKAANPPPEVTSTPAPEKSLAQVAKKKNVRDQENTHFEFKTRGSSVLKPENQRLQRFNLANFKKVETCMELQFMIQEMQSLVLEKMNSLGLSREEKATQVARLLKFYQKDGIFANCDNAIFYNIGNTVSIT